MAIEAFTVTARTPYGVEGADWVRVHVETQDVIAEGWEEAVSEAKRFFKHINDWSLYGVALM